MLQNADIRFAARVAQVPLKKIAKELKFSEPTLFRRLREPMTDEQRKQYLDIIHRLSQQNENK